jgi:outer membrane protein
MRNNKTLPEVSMDIRKTILPVIFTLLISFPVLVHAQNRTFSMDQVREMALMHNLNVLQSQNGLQSSQSAVLAAYGSYLPTLSASASWNRSATNRTSGDQLIGNQVVPLTASSSISNSFSTNLGVNYLLFNGFGREGSLRQAKANAAAAEYSFHRTKQSIVYQSQSDFLNILRTAELVRVSEENLKRDQRQQEQIDEGRNLGARSDADVFRQQSLVASDEVALITAKNNFDNAKADLISLIGLEISMNYSFDDASISTELDSARLDASIAKYDNFDNLKQRAKTTNPDVLGATENLYAADAGFTGAKSGYWPSLNASAAYRLSSPEIPTLVDNNTLNWGVTFSWTLFDGFRTNQSVQTADVKKKDAELNLLQTERNMNVAILKAYLQLVAARAQYDASAKGLVSSTEDRRIAEERYNLGAGTLLDLQTAAANYTNASVNKINAAYNFHLAVRNIEYAIGDGK